MSIKSIRTGWTGISALAGNPVIGDFESIATFSSSGSTKEINFTDIPSSYQHLQLRATFNNSTAARNVRMTLNTSVASTYWHYLFGLGSGTPTAGGSTQSLITVQDGFSTTNMYAMVLDILDYTNTNKNKTVRTLLGYDNNGNGVMQISSNLYSTTSAITAIRLQIDDFNWVNGSQFALYGIR